MPELKRNFQSGRMNKDLDERIVPSGEYRHALNIEVSASEDNDTGALQTVLGNTLINMPFTSLYTPQQATAIGSIVNDKNDRLYWFIADAGSDTTTAQYGDFYKADMILEYDWVSGVILPVVIDVYHTSCDVLFASASSTDPYYYLQLDSPTFWTTGIDMDYTIYPGMEVSCINALGTSIFPPGTLVKWICPQNRYIALDNYPITGSMPAPYSQYQINFKNPKRVLNFSKSRHITGINIVDDMLFWTDNFSEPKKINIPLSKQGSCCVWENHAHDNYDTSTNTGGVLVPACGSTATAAPFGHTRFQQIKPTAPTPNTYIDYGPIMEEHTTVIRRSPAVAPVLEMKNTQETGQIVAWLAGNPFIDTDGIIFTPADPIYNLTFLDVNLSLSISPSFEKGDYLTATLQGSDPSIEIRLQVVGVTATPGAPNTYNVVIVSYDSGANIDDGGETWEIELEDTDPLFQFKFPRFATRYKYEDGEYSAFSPFTEVAFLPDKFDYMPKEGYNLGMVNQLRSLVIKDFVHERLLPEDVVAIDILYKESNSPNIYSVETVKRKRLTSKWDSWNGTSDNVVENLKVRGFFRITSEMIHAALPSNQLLRPWDNVPRKALAQEITGNRLVYGNYLQNYNLKNYGKRTNDIDVEVEIGVEHMDVGSLPPEERDPKYAWYRENQGLHDWGSYGPAKSIKTLRTYQVGVIYIDDYGRETPVFSKGKPGKLLTTVDSATLSSLYLEKKFANKSNKLKATIKSVVPDWAKAFKFFIKETSNEYYNLAMDRWYNAEDDNIWLSFPSAERNKVDEETYLILKKEHDNNTFVPNPARYKIIAIENEAPSFIKIYPINMGILTDTSPSTLIGASGPTGWPQPGGSIVWVEVTEAWNQCKWVDYAAGGVPGKLEGDISDFWFRFRNPTISSEWYRVDEVKDLSISSVGYIQIKSKTIFGSELSSIMGTTFPGYGGVEMEMVKREEKNKPEFEGRFFVKIRKDLELINTIVNQNATLTQYTVAQSGISCYVNPQAGWNTRGARWISGNNNTDYGFGHDPDLISIEDKNNTAFGGTGKIGWIPNAPQGQGKEYWSQIAPNTGFAGQPGRSTGWFIDKVEAFRRFKFTGSYWGNDNSLCSHPHQGVGYSFNGPNQDWNAPWLYNFGYLSGVHDVQSGQQIETYTYINASWNAYLGIPNNQASTTTLLTAAASDGGQIVPSVGIGGTNTPVSTPWAYGPPGTGTNVIHLSYAGVGSDMTFSNTGCGSTGNWQNDFSYWIATVPVHQQEDAFITSIMTPGTIWWWKEDPGVQAPDGTWHPVVYQTQPWDMSTGQSSAVWADNGTDSVDGFQGIELYNYTSFMDYGIYNSHKAKTVSIWGPPCFNTLPPPPCDCSNVGCCGVSGVNWDENEISGWVSQSIPDECLSSNTPLFSWHEAGGANEIHLSHNTPTSGGWPYFNNGGPANAPLNPATSLAGNTTPHDIYPRLLLNWQYKWARRRRYQLYARALNYDDTSNPSVKAGLGGVGPHYYLPTNDPDNPAHFDVNGDVITIHPQTGSSFTNAVTEVAPGIRPDGMYCGAKINPWDFDESAATPSGSATQTYEIVPYIKRWDVVDGTVAATASETPPSGCVTWQILNTFIGSDIEKYSSTQPAIWETEPKEDVGLDIYHEVGQIYPVELNDDTIEQFVGAIHDDPSIPLTPTAAYNQPSRYTANSQVTSWSFGGFAQLSTDVLGATLTKNVSQDIRVIGARDNIVMLGDINGNPLDGAPPAPPINGVQIIPNVGDVLSFFRADGSMTESTIIAINGNEYTLFPNVHDRKVHLPWFNCYSFGNGVESDRIRDDFNQVTIDNGPKASTTLEEPYKEERRGSGFIWSGIYNSTSGINNLNQFIQAEKITKDLNPIYGTIQKLHQRDTDLLTLCEDKVFKVVSHKDALYKADGNPQLVATDKVLGQTTPFAGEYGISKNPESFASESFRFYFADKTRGVVLRLSQNGITPISNTGMRDWFADNLKSADKILGTFNSYKNSYNITISKYGTPGRSLTTLTTPTLPSTTLPTSPVISSTSTSTSTPLSLLSTPYTSTSLSTPISSLSTPSGTTSPTSISVPLSGLVPGTTIINGSSTSPSIPSSLVSPSQSKDVYQTLSYVENTRGWSSFKSFIPEEGESLNNTYYTFNKGHLYKHHDNPIRNNFYGINYNSSVKVLFNDFPGSVKSFGGLNYEGSQAKITFDPNNPDYYDNPIDKSTLAPISRLGWYVDLITTNLQTGNSLEFKNKEDKWWSKIKGEETVWLGDGTAGNVDPREFSVQGIGLDCCTEYTDPTTGNVVQTGDCCGTSTPIIIYGCTDDGSDPSFPGRPAYMTSGAPATNYDAAAAVDDGSCTYPPPSVSFNCTNTGCVDPLDGSGQYSTWCDCMEQGGTTLSAYPNPGTPCCDSTLAPGVFGYNWGLYESQCLGLPGGGTIFGCTDPSASNYYAAATIDACNCIYTVPTPGCTDPLACNFDPLANVDDGSCITDVYHEYEICSIPFSGQYTTALANLSVGMRINFFVEGGNPPVCAPGAPMWPVAQYPTMNYTAAMDNCSWGYNLSPTPGDIIGLSNSNNIANPLYATFPDHVVVGCFKYIGTSCTKAANGGIGIGNNLGSTSGIWYDGPSCTACSNVGLNNVCTTNCGQL